MRGIPFFQICQVEDYSLVVSKQDSSPIEGRGRKIIWFLKMTDNACFLFKSSKLNFTHKNNHISLLYSCVIVHSYYDFYKAHVTDFWYIKYYLLH